MASKLFVSFFTFTLVLFTILPLISSQSISKQSHEKKSPSLVFLNHIQGAQKGNKLEEIHKLKKYLQHFGYLNNIETHSEITNDDEFDDALDSAIRTYQKNYNLKVTGILDAKTIAQMSKPRCGVADIIINKTWMRSGKTRDQNHHHSHGNGNFHFNTVSHFAFFEGNPKWPASKSNLTYEFLPGTPSESMSPISRAFATWGSNTHFTFSQATGNNSGEADIKISFQRGDHGDGYPFDGVGGVIAHAFSPSDGRFHYDADETLGAGVVSGSYDYETIALHEIGHLLGLQHSSIEGAIMWPTIPQGATKGLHADDLAGIKALYSNTI